MPEMDGITASKIIKKQCTGRACPKIIAMTANAMKEDKEKCLTAGLDDFMSKPIRIEELHRILLYWGEIITKNENSMMQNCAEKPCGDKIVIESDILFIKDIITESDALFFGELLDAYISELPTMIGEINSTAENNDYNNLYFNAHKLKGSSMTLGINSVARICEELEAFAKEQNMNARTKELYEELVKKFEQVIEELEVIKEKYTKFPL